VGTDPGRAASSRPSRVDQERHECLEEAVNSIDSRLVDLYSTPDQLSSAKAKYLGSVEEH